MVEIRIKIIFLVWRLDLREIGILQILNISDVYESTIDNKSFGCIIELFQTDLFLY